MERDNVKSRGDIQNGHNGKHLCRKARNLFNAAYYDCRAHSPIKERSVYLIDSRSFRKSFRYRKILKRNEILNHYSESESPCERNPKLCLCSYTLFHIKGRPAPCFSVGLLVSVIDSESDFNKFCSHSDHCGKPHPEEHSRPTESDCACHTAYIACAYCACYGYTCRLIRRDNPGSLCHGFVLADVKTAL